MIPIRVTLSGFMSYQETQTLDFSSDSLWVLIGKNASGKSTVFDAIIFVLFGKGRVKGITNADLVNHYSDRAIIVFDFAVGNSLYRVRRTIDKKGHATRQAALLIPKTDGTFSEPPIPGTDREIDFNRWVENDIGLNFDVFTTSILLRQGKADAFLEAGTDVRYSLLSQLIDLSKYEILANKAHEWKKYWNAQADTHRHNLDRSATVTEESLAQAQREINQETEAVLSLNNNVKYLTSLFGQATQWELLNREMISNQTHLEEINNLLMQKEEIKRNYQRWSDLRNILPQLRTVSGLAARISSVEAEISRLADELKKSIKPLQEADKSVTSLTENVLRQEKQVEELQTVY